MLYEGLFLFECRFNEIVEENTFIVYIFGKIELLAVHVTLTVSIVLF